MNSSDEMPFLEKNVGKTPPPKASWRSKNATWLFFSACLLSVVAHGMMLLGWQKLWTFPERMMRDGPAAPIYDSILLAAISKAKVQR